MHSKVTKKLFMFLSHVESELLYKSILTPPPLTLPFSQRVGSRENWIFRLSKPHKAFILTPPTILRHIQLDMLFCWTNCCIFFSSQCSILEKVESVNCFMYDVVVGLDNGKIVFKLSEWDGNWCYLKGNDDAQVDMIEKKIWWRWWRVIKSFM